MSNFDNDFTEDGLKAQLCDAASHELTAYKGATYEEGFRMDLLHRRHAVVQILYYAGQWYNTAYCYKAHKVNTKIN